MKTQLLEDIGQSASLSLTPAVPDLARKAHIEPARARAARGVWRPRPPDAPIVFIPQPALQGPAAPDVLHRVVEELAALEAQFEPPPIQAPARPAARIAPAPADPLFDSTAPARAAQPAPPVHRLTPAQPTRPRGRYLLWGACLVAAAALIQGGRWWHQQRADAASPALAAAAQARPPVLNPALMAPLAPPADEAPAPALPPLVMLAPEPPAAKPEARPAPAVGRAARPKAVKPEPAAMAKAAPPSTQRANRPARVQPAASATKQAKREPARAPAARPARPAAPPRTSEATLKACRERGYHAALCIKRGCSLTEHGFACRAR